MFTYESRASLTAMAKVTYKFGYGTNVAGVLLN
jgi:hypothetical protein